MKEIKAAKWYILDYLCHHTYVTRDELMDNRGGFKYETFLVALAELNSEGKIWLISDGTIEIATKTATL